MLKGFVFDIGGVLVRDVMEYLFEFDNCGIVKKYQLDPVLVRQVSALLWQKYSKTSVDLEESWQQQERDFWDEFKQLTKLEVPIEELIELSKEYVIPVDGMRELIKELHEQKYDLLICSNNIEFFYQHGKTIGGFGKYFEKRKVILSNHHGTSKSNVDFKMFKAIEQQMEFPKEKYLFIDDRKRNIERALEFGIPSLLFPAESIHGSTYIKSLLSVFKK